MVGPLKGNMPKFYMKPVTEFGDAVGGQEGNRLSDEGTLNCLRHLQRALEDEKILVSPRIVKP